MKIDSEHLEILAQVIQHGGLTEGAAAVGKSQPSVSRTMALLEARVGAPLFVPGRRPLRPTDLGTRLARLGSRIHACNREASAIVDNYRCGRVGRLRISGTPFFMDGVVAPLIAEFQVKNPDVAIEQSYGYADALLTGLRNETLDIALVPLRPEQRPADMTFTPLIAGRNVIACRAEHPLTRTKSITAADLAQFSWIAPPPDSPLHRDLQSVMKSFGLQDFRVAFSGGTYASIVSLLTGSDTLTVLPASVVAMTGRTSGMVALSLRIEHPDRTLGIVSPTARAMDPALRRLCDFLSAQFQWIDARLRHGDRDAQWRR